VARAGKLAERLERDCQSTGTALGECCCGEGQADDADPRITRAFLLVAGRAPSPEERDATRRFLATQPARYPALSGPEARRHAWADFCQMLLASDAFLYVECRS
jgi:hypothetical protein